MKATLVDKMTEMSNEEFQAKLDNLINPDFMKILGASYKGSEYLEKAATMVVENASHLILFPNQSNLKHLQLSGWFLCDAKDCDWKGLNGITRKNYFLIRNLPCPKCGANIFTEHDYSTMAAISWVMNWPIIRFINWLGKKFNRTSKFRVHMNGTGKIDLEKVDE